ncbi:tRNA-dihydrouridine synthase family protein [Candidatus Saccharibacteria bacterium]|nr:tRNA-dihydrouridine synthase family protein [Candidatus Saccharibacteria bacterium]
MSTCYIIFLMNFWSQFEKGFTCLAPMEGVTDIAFRQVIARAARPDIFFTEFTNVNSYSSEKGRPNALERLRFEPSEQPIVAQIWGKNPEMFKETVEAVKNLGFQAVDINMGCPERHVVATGGGSGLIRTPELAKEILKAAKEVEGITVSVKTRLGYTKTDEWKAWLTNLLEEHPAALTVHLRTKKEMSKVDAHYELIPEIVELKNQLSPDTKLIINGDIKSAAEAQKFVEQGVDGIMIGRGVFQNPFCFEKTPKVHTREELLDLMNYHLDLYEKYELHPYDPLKHFYKIYVNNFPGASDLRAELMQTKTIAEARKVISRI